MSNAVDERIAEGLMSRAPARRDALFRLTVLERRERLRFRRQAGVMVATASCLAALLGAGLFVRPDMALAISAAGLAAALSIGAYAYRPALVRLARPLRPLRRFF